MSESQDNKRITHQFLQVVRATETWADRIFVPALLGIAIVYAAMQALDGSWIHVIIPGFSIALLLALSTNHWLQFNILGQPFSRKHALYVALFWIYSLLWLELLLGLTATPSTGKGSQFYYVLLLMFLMVTWRMALTLLLLTRWGFRTFITEIPIWEQLLVVVNEVLAGGLLAYIGGGLLAQILQPDVFSLRIDPLYNLGLLGVIALYYLGMQLMWLQQWNNWFSRNEVWVGMARLLAPLALFVISLEIAKRFARLSDPRTVNLLGGKEVDLTVLALAPIVWLVIVVLVFLVYTGRRGLRQRFLPDELLEQFPVGLKRVFSSVSDMDMLLILGLLSTFIPAHFFLVDDQNVGLLDILRQQIFQQGSAFIETSEQALALIFTIPFYMVILLLLVLYAIVISRSTLPAEKRNELVTKLPNGFLIVMVIMLYLCAVPFTRVLTSGRLPRLPQDLGAILVFYVLIPLLILYFHYFLLVRIPYGRGQARWRERSQAVIRAQLITTENSIAYLSERIRQLETEWRDAKSTESPATTAKRLDLLYHYVEINSERDNLNMNKLRVLSELQELTENEIEIPLAIARLPTRIIRYGIPLLLAINIYQWAVVGDGLKQLANSPNINIVDFFRIILQQTQF
jgi:hypothetical protein